MTLSSKLGERDEFSGSPGGGVEHMGALRPDPGAVPSPRDLLLGVPPPGEYTE